MRGYTQRKLQRMCLGGFKAWAYSWKCVSVCRSILVRELAPWGVSVQPGQARGLVVKEGPASANPNIRQARLLVSHVGQLWLTWAVKKFSSSFSGLNQDWSAVCCLLLQDARGRDYLQTGCALQEPVETPALPCLSRTQDSLWEVEGGAHQVQMRDAIILLLRDHGVLDLRVSCQYSWSCWGRCRRLGNFCTIIM